MARNGTEAAPSSRRNLVLLAGAALLLGAVAVLSAATGTRPTEDGAGVHFGWLALLPGAVTIVLAFTTRHVLAALFLGIATGGVVYAFGAGVPLSDWGSFPWLRLNVVQSFILEELGTRNYAVILFVYLWCLGGLVGLWGRTGGAWHFVERISRFVRGPRSAKFLTWLLGVTFHQGGIISVLLAGTTARPILDRHPVAKEEAAYIVDSTATSAATLVPFNVWPLFVGGVVAGTIPFFVAADGAPDVGKATAFYFQALPFHFYGFFALVATLLMAAGWMPLFGGMRRARRRVEQTGQTVRPGSRPLTPKELTERHVPPGYVPGLPDFLLPLAFLVVVAIGPFVIQSALGRPATVYIVEAFFLALLVGILVAVAKGMHLRDALDGIVDGAKGVTVAAIILGLAVTLKGVADALGTGPFVAGLLGGVPAALLPALLMVAGMVIAFSTGTSFGTFAVLFPVAMPLADAVLPGSTAFLAMCFAAVLGGSIFGDQASPISDTTVLSGLTVGCDLMDHVTTQMPYAALAAALALGMYLVLGFAMF